MAEPFGSRPTRRQFLSIGAAGVTALALGGCGGSGKKSGKQDVSSKKSGAMSNYAVGQQFKATQPLTFSIMMLSNPAYPYNANWPFFTDLKQKTNVGFTPVVVPLSDYNQKRSVMINGGNAPMIIPKTYHPDEEQYVGGGAILPVSDYVDLMPNFQDKVKKWNLGTDLDSIRQGDGKFYLLPGLHQQVWVDYSMAVRTDILKKLNLPIPKTWDDFYKMLKAMKQAHPDIYPFSDRWSNNGTGPGANAFFETISTGFNTYAGWTYQNAFWDAGQKKFVFTGAMDEYKQMVQYVNKLVTEKLMDPESFTQQDDQAIQKFSSGKSFVMSTNAQTLVSDLRKGISGIPGATVVKIPVPLGPAGAVVQGSRLENGVMITTKAKDSKDFVAMMQFIDWLWYSDAGEIFAKWGIQGETYTGNVDDGTFKLSPKVSWGGLNPHAPKNLQTDYGFYNGVFAYGGSTALLNTQFSPEEKQFQKVMNSRKALPVSPPHPLTQDQREQAALWETGLTDYVNQQTLQFVLGRRPLSDWNTYLNELKGKNMTEYIDTVNKAYQTYQSKNA